MYIRIYSGEYTPTFSSIPLTLSRGGHNRPNPIETDRPKPKKAFGSVYNGSRVSMGSNGRFPVQWFGPVGTRKPNQYYLFILLLIIISIYQAAQQYCLFPSILSVCWKEIWSNELWSSILLCNFLVKFVV
jgi:hypothetical protein